MATKLGVKRDRRAEVLSAAVKLFVTKGYYATTMDDVALAVQLNKGTLYHYYDSKSNILFDIILRITDQRLAVVRDLPKTGAPDVMLKHYVEDLVKFIVKNPVETKLSMQETPFLEFWLTKEQTRIIRDRFAELENFLKKLIEDGIATGFFTNMNARVATELIVGMVSWLPRWYRPSGQLGAEQLAQQVSAFALNALKGNPNTVADSLVPSEHTTKRGSGGSDPIPATRRQAVAPKKRLKAKLS